MAVFDPNAFITDNVSHVPEDRNAQGLIGDMSIAENLVLKATDQPQFSKGHGLLLNKPAIHEYAEEMVKKYDVRCTSTEQSVRSLSGGNQQKVILARELAKKIEEEMEYPGQIKVHVLRETTAIEYAK